MKRDSSVGTAPLAIIGIGCLFPGAEDPSSYWTNVREGIDAITDIPSTHWQVNDYFDGDPRSPDRTYGRRGGFLSPYPFNPMEFNIPPNTLEAIDTSQLLGMVAAGQALRDAGYGPEREYDRSRVSVILGVTGTLELVIPLGARLGHPLWRKALQEAGVADDVADDVVARIGDSYVQWQENSFPGLLGNVVAGRISKQFDLGGTNCVVDAACASSFSALHLAAMELTTGKSDMVVTGGIDTFNDIFMYMCFSKTPALSPTGNARPFDAAGDGTILGEGLGIVVIKRLEDAERDGDRIYAVIRGVGSSSDGKGDAIYAPSAAGQKNALLDAYRRSEITPDSIGMVEAHGTGTKVGDAVEVSALREVYGEADSPWCALGSVKSQIGHTKAAAGAAGLIKTALALHHKVLPPTLKVENPLPEVTRGATPFYLCTEKRPWLPRGGAPRRAGISAFGFGGSNFHAVLEEYRPEKQVVDWDGGIQILPFSGSRAEIGTALKSMPAESSWSELRGKAAELRALFDAGAECRLALVVERRRNDLAALIGKAASMLASSAPSWSTPDGIFFSSGERRGNTGILFPGQGAQYTGMLRDLACAFPQMMEALAAADDGFLRDGVARLSDSVYPPSAFDRESRERQEEALRRTEAAQPAIGAVSLGALRVLEDFGVRGDAFAGHSYGELTSLCAAGVLQEEDFHALSRLRGRLMGQGRGDKGSMLAVAAPLEEVERVLAEENLELVIANRNAPTQAVLSGKSGEIDRAAAAFSARNLSCKKLPVAAAFHSPLVSDAAEPFLAALAEVELVAAAVPVYANTTAALYPGDPAAARELLARQLARPVEFVAEIEAMYAAGVRIFIEVGPGGRLTGLVKAILGEREHHAFALDASAGSRSGIADLARTLAQAAVCGLPVRLASWDEGYRAPAAKKGGMIIPICGANYRKPLPPRPPRPAAPPSPAPAAQPFSPAAPTPASASPVSRESLALLQKMQEETALLHRRFLEGQEAAARTFRSLLEQRGMGGEGFRPVSAPVSAAVAAPAVQPPPAAAAPAQAPAAPPAAAAPAIAETLLAVVSEKTGYPVEMLELDMGLDSDLGIDSIKRVEILSALQERIPGAPVIGPEHLGTLRTLGEIARHLSAGASPAGQAPTPGAAPGASAAISEILLAVVSEKTGYPVEMLELDMGLDSDLGIDSIKRVEILSALQERIPGAPVIGPEHLGTLRTLGEIARHLGAGAAPPPPAAASAAGISEILLAVVSEKTGYPVEMLELDMGLDSDLGIDSIKRVEILSALQERIPGAPAIGPEHLATLRTLGEISLHLGAGAAVPAVQAPPPAAAPAPTEVAGTLLAVVSEKTGYPVEMLELDMKLDADLGIDSIKRVEILSALQERLPGAPAIGPEHLATLRTLGEIAAHLQPEDAPPAAAQEKKESSHAAAPATHLVEPIRRSTPVAVPLPSTAEATALNPEGEVWISGDGTFGREMQTLLRSRGIAARFLPPGEEGDALPPRILSALIIAAPRSGTDDLFLADSFLLLKKAAPSLGRAGESGGAVFLTVSRLDGAFGFGGGLPGDPLSGGLAGMAKTAAREWPGVQSRALDLAGFASPAAEAAAAADELFRRGPAEVGLTPSGRSALVLSELPLPEAGEAPVSPGEVVVVTGGGRGVTAAAAVALARAWSPFLLLLGRSPEPAGEPSWLSSLSEEGEMKRAILEHAAGKLHPRDIEERYRAVVAGRELQETLSAIRSAGGRAIYRSVDIRDAAAVSALLQEIRREHGAVRGIVHGAGVLADRNIVDKTAAQFDAVYGTKVEGLRSLLQAASGDELRFLALFSSTTGRFGRAGQVDYAVANEVLNKLAQAEARKRSGCRVVSINWGPWDGGMVTPSLKKLFAGEGIGLIGLAEGGEFLVREICAAASPVEVVAIAGGAEEETAAAPPAASRTLHEALSLTLTVQDYPFLRSHVLDGKAVLPMAVIVEWMAHGALHGNPGFRFHGFNDLRICKGVTFGEKTTCTVRIMAGRAEKRDSFYLVPVELCSGGSNGSAVLHARAEIVLATRLPEGIRSIAEIPSSPYSPGNGELYSRERLFHGPDLHGIEEVEGCGEKGIAALVKRAPAPANWIRQPLRSTWLTDPLALDSAFQLMILWSFERYGAGSLPCFAGRYRQFSDSFPRDGVQVAIRVSSQRESGATADIEFLERHSGKLVARMEGYECVIDPSLERAFQRNQLSRSVELGAA